MVDWETKNGRGRLEVGWRSGSEVRERLGLGLGGRGASERGKEPEGGRGDGMGRRRLW